MSSLTYGGSVSFYPSGVSNLRLDSDTHGMSNHVYVYKSPDGSFQLLAPEFLSGGDLCYGDMAAIKIVSGHNVGQTINAKNVEDYLAWQGETTFPSDELFDLIQAFESAAQSCSQSGVSDWFKCVFGTVDKLFQGLAAATSIKQYLYQFPIILNPNAWTGKGSGGVISAGDTVQFLTLQTSISSEEMYEAVGTYWLILAMLSYLRSGKSPALLARYQALKGSDGLSLPTPKNLSALDLLYTVSPSLYDTLTDDPTLFSFQTSDSDDKKGWLRQKSKGDSSMIQDFVLNA